MSAEFLLQSRKSIPKKLKSLESGFLPTIKESAVIYPLMCGQRIFASPLAKKISSG